MSQKHDSNEKPQGLVAQIINARELAINIGENHGVERGMIFAILAESPIEVRDPKTDEVLDSIDREKVRVQAIEVREKITVCRTYRKKRIPGGVLYDSPAAMLTREPQEIVETLKAEDSSYPEPLSEEESFVKIGDRAVFIE